MDKTDSEVFSSFHNSLNTLSSNEDDLGYNDEISKKDFENSKFNHDVISENSLNKKSSANKTQNKFFIKTTRVSAPKKSLCNSSLKTPDGMKPNNSSSNLDLSSVVEGCNSPHQPKPLVDKTNSTNVTAKTDVVSYEAYQGLLKSDPNCDENREEARRKLRRIKRKDLENLIIEQFCNQVLYETELGNQKALCERLENTLEAANKKAMKLTVEVENLKSITSKLAMDHKERKGAVILPPMMKRCVGIQCQITTKCTNNLKKRKLSASPAKDYRIRKALDHEPLSDNSSYSNDSLSLINKDYNSSYSRSNKYKKLHLEGESENSLDYSLYVPPPPDLDIILSTVECRPSKPFLKAKRKDKSIIMSWDMPRINERISGFQLYSCEVQTNQPSFPSWQNIGEVRAMELPMMCTLTDFKSGNCYHFAVRALDGRSRRGPFSNVQKVKMP